MSFRERITDSLGAAIGGAIDLATDTLKKANTVRSDEPPNRGTGGTTALSSNTQAQALPPEPATADPQAILHDPFALVDQLGYRDRPSGMTYEILRAMGKKVPTYLAISQTRVTQVASFGQRQKDPRLPGFGVILRDDKATPTKQDKIRMRQLEDWLLQTGARYTPDRDDFKTFLKKLVRDSLHLDQGCFEVVYNRKGLPSEFYALDGATIRLADVPPGAVASADPDQVRYVQVYDEVIIAEFSAWDLCFGVRNPRTDIRCNGYGFSELEMLIHVVTALLWAFEYNKRFFSQGTAAQGILNFKGQVPQQKLDGFRRQWQMMISGVANAHRTPMANFDDVQWIDLRTDNQRMGYADWMDWLNKVCCGVMQFDPAEINFNYGNSGQTSQMFSTPTESKIRESKDRGLRPLLSDIAGWINRYLIWPYDPSMEFGFFGLDTRSADQEADLGKKKASFLMTVDELRAEEDLPPLPDGQGEVILDSVWLQNKQASMGGEEGGFGEDEGAEEGGGAPQEAPDFDQVYGSGQDEGAQKDQAFAGAFGQKSLPPGELRKSDRAKVTVYEIEL